jgi:hypothetical protein
MKCAFDEKSQFNSITHYNYDATGGASPLYGSPMVEAGDGKERGCNVPAQ